MVPTRTAALVLISGLVVVSIAGCGSGDPVQDVLRERARWKAEVRSFVVLPDGSSRVTLQVVGPVRSSLQTLTVRVELVDRSGEVLHASWYPIDLSDVQRGVPAEKMVPLPPTSPAPDGVNVDPIRSPSEQDIQHMPELSGAVSAD